MRRCIIWALQHLLSNRLRPVRTFHRDHEQGTGPFGHTSLDDPAASFIGRIFFSSAFVGACERSDRIQPPHLVNACQSRSSALNVFFLSGMQNAAATSQPGASPGWLEPLRHSLILVE